MKRRSIFFYLGVLVVLIVLFSVFVVREGFAARKKIEYECGYKGKPVAGKKETTTKTCGSTRYKNLASWTGGYFSEGCKATGTFPCGADGYCGYKEESVTVPATAPSVECAKTATQYVTKGNTAYFADSKCTTPGTFSCKL